MNLGEDVNKLYRETMDEVLRNLMERTQKLLQKFKEEAKKNRMKLK